MELTFTDPNEFEDFAYVYLLGQQVHRKGHRLELKAPATVVGELAVELKPGESFDRLQREVLACVMADTGLTEEQLTEPQPGAWELDHVSLQEVGDNADTVVHEHIDLPPAEESEPDKPKRKRRTKAEIEAAALAEQRTLDPSQEPEPGEAPVFDIPEVLEHVPAEGQEKLPDTPLDKPNVHASADAVEKHAAAQAEYTPELLETLKGQAELFDANRTAHLNEGREAIAKHGFIKYMATFKGLGLDSAIATYNDEQVKLHRAAIAHLMAS